MNFLMFKLDLEKAEDRDQIANIRWIIEKTREFQKNIYFCFMQVRKQQLELDMEQQTGSK